MKRSRYILFCLSLMLGFSSCEMKDEILGKGEVGADAGTLEIGLSAVYNNNVITTRADVATDGGATAGQFNDEDMNIDNYTLIVTNSETQEEVENGIVGELKGEDGKVSVLLNPGKYTVKAYNYEGADVNVSERPYFEGTSDVTISSGMVSAVDLSCKLACVEVALNLTESFKNAFEDDYVIIVNTGDGASYKFTSENIGTTYYFKTPVNKNSLTVSVKATSKEGNPISMEYTVQKPADAEGGVANLEGGDSFLINLTEQGATDSYAQIGISVDLTFTDEGSTIEIPVENIVYDGPDFPDSGDEPEPSDEITFIGLPADYSAVKGSSTIEGLQDVTIKVSPNSTGIKSLNVTISGAISSLLGMVGLPETFDICNLDDDLKGVLVGLELITEEDYANLSAGTVKEFTFKLGSLLVLVPQVTDAGTKSIFNLSVNDGVTIGEGDITVNVQ